MGQITDYFASQSLGWQLTADSPTRPTEWHMGLFEFIPSDAGTGGQEFTGTNYARSPVAFEIVNTVSGVLTSSLDFGPASGWPTVGGIGIWDANSGGNLLFWSTEASSSIADNNYAFVDSSSFAITLT